MLLLGMPGPFELAIIFLVVLLLFGASRLPEIGRSLGQGIREFRRALKGGAWDDKEELPPEKKDTK